MDRIGADADHRIALVDFRLEIVPPWVLHHHHRGPHVLRQNVIGEAMGVGDHREDVVALGEALPGRVGQRIIGREGRVRIRRCG